MSNNTNFLNISKEPKINELCARVFRAKTSMQRAFCAFANKLSERIKDANSKEKKAGSLIFSNTDFISIIDDQTQKKTQTRDFRTILLEFHIIAHAVSDVNYRDGRRDKRVMSKSKFQILIEHSTIKEFIRIFCA